MEAKAMTEELNECLSVSPDPLPAGGTATITIEAGHPGPWPITCTISKVGQPSQTVLITKQDDGSGEGTWDVDVDWSSAIFTVPGCESVGVIIIQP